MIKPINNAVGQEETVDYFTARQLTANFGYSVFSRLQSDLNVLNHKNKNQRVNNPRSPEEEATMINSHDYFI